MAAVGLIIVILFVLLSAVGAYIYMKKKNDAAAAAAASYLTPTTKKTVVIRRKKTTQDGDKETITSQTGDGGTTGIQPTGPPPIPPAVENSAVVIENLTLGNLAKQEATKKWCQSMSMIYNPDTESCVHTQKSCDKAQEFAESKRVSDPENYGYNYEWHPEVNACVKVQNKIPDVCVRISQMFDNENTQVATLPYVKPVLACDKYGGCQVLVRPACKITRDYCNSKGIDTDTDDRGDDCYLSTGQEIGEMLIGSKFIRKFRAGGPGAVALAAGETYAQFMERGGLMGIGGGFIGNRIGGKAGSALASGLRCIGGGCAYDAVSGVVNFVKDPSGTLHKVEDVAKDVGGKIGDAFKDVGNTVGGWFGF